MQEDNASLVAFSDIDCQLSDKDIFIGMDTKKTIIVEEIEGKHV